MHCQVNEHLQVRFQDRQNITATFSCEDVAKTFEVSGRAIEGNREP